LLDVHGSWFAFAVPQLGQLSKTGVVHWYPGKTISYLAATLKVAAPLVVILALVLLQTW
jgi:hypothetical protein